MCVEDPFCKSGHMFWKITLMGAPEIIRIFTQGGATSGNRFQKFLVISTIFNILTWAIVLVQ